jgi:hypothetical protein
VGRTIRAGKPVGRGSHRVTIQRRLAIQVESKHDQAERIGNRLEALIERQASRLQQSRAQQPGLIALPGARSRWQQGMVHGASRAISQDAPREVRRGHARMKNSVVAAWFAGGAAVGMALMALLLAR